MAGASPEIIIEAMRKMIAHHSQLEQTDERKRAIAVAQNFLSAFEHEYEKLQAEEKAYVYGDPPDEVLEALFNDLNTPQVVTLMHQYRKNGETHKLAATMNFMGLL